MCFPILKQVVTLNKRRHFFLNRYTIVNPNQIVLGQTCTEFMMINHSPFESFIQGR